MDIWSRARNLTPTIERKRETMTLIIISPLVMFLRYCFAYSG
jgi:hypothetical protein